MSRVNTDCLSVTESVRSLSDHELMKLRENVEKELMNREAITFRGQIRRGLVAGMAHVLGEEAVFEAIVRVLDETDARKSNGSLREELREVQYTINKQDVSRMTAMALSLGSEAERPDEYFENAKRTITDFENLCLKGKTVLWDAHTVCYECEKEQISMKVCLRASRPSMGFKSTPTGEKSLLDPKHSDFCCRDWDAARDEDKTIANEITVTFTDREAASVTWKLGPRRASRVRGAFTSKWSDIIDVMERWDTEHIIANFKVAPLSLETLFG
jgi:hypothetical protein